MCQIATASSQHDKNVAALENLKLNEDLSTFNHPAAENVVIHQKMDELIALLSSHTLPNETLQDLRLKFNTAIRDASTTTALQPFVKGVRRKLTEEEEEELDQLLSLNEPDFRKQRKVGLYAVLGRVIRLIIALLLILLGFGMIIMPAPAYFEMFTLFYLSQNDGVTIMDIISLIVAFTGVYLLISTIAKLR